MIGLPESFVGRGSSFNSARPFTSYHVFMLMRPRLSPKEIALGMITGICLMRIPYVSQSTRPDERDSKNQ